MPQEIRGAHFLIRSAQLVRKNTLRIGPGAMCAVCDCLVPVGHKRRYRKRLAVRESTLRRPRISHYLEHACQHNASELTPEISRTARVTRDLGAGLECAFITRNQSTTAARAAAAELQYIYTVS